MRPYTWDQLRRLSLARQFPRVRGRGPAQVAATVARIGPLQTQTARSAFLGLAARLPGLDHAAVSRAYEDLTIVRGSVHRGTVHTATPEQQVLLDRATRLGQRRVWERTFRPTDLTVDDLWVGLERFAADTWRTPDELAERLTAMITGHGDPEAPGVSGTTPARTFGFGHGGLIRRPLSGGWEGQGRPGYRTARTAVAERHPDRVPELDRRYGLSDVEAVAELVLLHLRSYGPATETDVVWWSGLGVRPVRAAVEALGERLVRRPGPDGLVLLDPVDAPTRGVDGVGTRLLPEFDALLCGYAPALRTRFVTAADHAVLWNPANALLSAPLLHHGRVAGWWGLTGTSTRRLVVTGFTGAPRPDLDDLAPAVADVASVLAVRIGDVELR